MENVSIIILFLFVLFTLLGTGVWVGLALMGVAWVGMELFTTRPVGDVIDVRFLLSGPPRATLKVPVSSCRRMRSRAV